ncbi:2Fe-2S iron-sulfur cluster-binding protein [Streptomyces sp. M18.1]
MPPVLAGVPAAAGDGAQGTGALTRGPAASFRRTEAALPPPALAVGVGVEGLSSCTEGTCGTCETEVVEGEPDHRDSLLTEEGSGPPADGSPRGGGGRGGGVSGAARAGPASTG